MALTLASCSNNKIKNDYKNLVGSEINIPYDSFDVVNYGLINNQEHKEWTFVSYVDSVECTPVICLMLINGSMCRNFLRKPVII